MLRGLPLLPVLLLAACEREARAVTVVPVEADARAGEAPLAATPRVEEPPPQESHVELPGGLVRDLVEPGRRLAAQVGDRLRIHLDVRLAGGEAEGSGGEVLESTRGGGAPLAITLGRGEVIRGLERGLLGVHEGAQVRLLVPSALAYGERGLGRVPPDADLALDVRLVAIERP